MKLLNLGCGFPRIAGEEWTNLDNLLAQLPDGTPEKANLAAETNYVEHDILAGPLPFADGEFDGVLASHVFEHFDCQQAVKIMADCRRILKPGGVLLVSVPDASYFRKVHHEDRNANWPRLFDVSDPDNPIPTFFQAALFFDEHRAVLTEDALWCYLTRAGFTPHRPAASDVIESASPMGVMNAQLNRRKFSLEFVGVKS